MYIHWPVYFPPVNPYCDPVSGVPKWCMALSQDPNMPLLFFFPSIHCAAQPQLVRSHRGIPLLVESGPQDTEPSFHGDFTNTPGPERTSLWQGATMETGTDHKAQFLGIQVPGITPVVLQTPEEHRRQRCWRSEGDAVFQGALWLIGEKQSDHSCQMHRMNVNKPIRMLKSAFFRKKKSGEVWTDKSIDRGTD